MTSLLQKCRDTMRSGNDAQRAPSAAPRILNASSRVCPEFVGLSLRNQTIFRSKIDEGGGLENRRLGNGKMPIRQVPIPRILSVYGEVAERLKAAVC